ncbi:helix-turn-helix transcriptional regulator [Planosporangium sp. 12N6]|uniref:helix-turn-helix transcriptional regulator n=1 Tax=Planosporangium spinosum TaxID=3402278 RepID=UPI003CE680EA
MRPQRFSLVTALPVDGSAREALAERCPDVTVTPDPDGPGALVGFERDAPTLVDAVVSAVRDLDAVGVQALGVRDDDLVTLAEIADRIGRSREAVRRWAAGRTGPGAFPPPADVRVGTAHYRWTEAAPWLRQRLGVPVPDTEAALAALDLALRLRALAPRVARMDAIRALLAA